MKIKVCILVVALICMSVLTCHGQMNGLPVQEGSAIVVSGSVPNGKGGVMVTAIVPKKGATEADLKTGILNDNLHYVGQTSTQLGGGYRFEIFLPLAVTDEQVIIRVGEGSYATPISATIEYIPIANIISAVNGVSDAYSVSSTLAQNRQSMEAALSQSYLGLEATGALSDYKALSDKNFVLDYLLDVVKNASFPTSTDAQLQTSIASIRQHFKTAVGIAVLDTANIPLNMDSALNRYADSLLLDLNAYNQLDNGGFGSDKTFVCNAVFPVKLQTKVDVQNTLAGALAVLNLNKTISWEQVGQWVQSNAQTVGIDISATSVFGRITNKNNFYKKYAELIPFTTISGTVSGFDSTAAGVLAGENSPSGNNTGGGGGGGGSVIPTVNTIKPVDSVEPADTDFVSAQGFVDLESVPWAKQAILGLADRGVINGATATEFMPENLVTRAEFLKMVLKAFALSTTDNTADFVDVFRDDWFYEYVATAQKLGMVSGKPDGTFAPNETIARQDMAVILENALKCAGKQLAQLRTVTFSDEREIADYAEKSVAYLANAGVINGRENNYFAPNDFATRAEAAKMIFEIDNNEG